MDFVLIKKSTDGLYVCNVKAIPGEFQHALLVAYVDKKIYIRNVVKKTCAERRKIRLQEDVNIRKQFEEKVLELVYIGVPNLW